MSTRSLALCVALFGAWAGIATAGEPPVVPVAQPVARTVTDYAEFTGRTMAAQSVEIRARVTGYLVTASFKEGAAVKAGDVLFTIDPRPYQAMYEKAVAELALSRATLKLAQFSFKRDTDIAARAPGSISQQQLDQDRAAVDEAEARVMAYQASLDVQKLNLDFTKVRAPIDGRISRYYETPGNLVFGDKTILTTIVSLDPMYVYFDMDERTLLQIHRAINDGKVKDPATTACPVTMGLVGDAGYPHTGTINFVDNRVDPEKGTIAVRCTLPNPRPANGVALIMPGMFARGRFPIGEPYKALVVPDKAILHDNDGDFVFAVNAKDMLERRSVQLGQKQPGGMQAIRSGITAEDRIVLVVARGLKAGLAVRPQKTSLPE
jgi:membrane fusion protein, multidrug efflux system